MSIPTAPCFASSAASAASASSGRGPASIDLRTWKRAAGQRFGSWRVDANGNAVLQERNGPPSLFLSPDAHLDVTLSGTLEVLDAGDDDFVGIVLGYRDDPDTGHPRFLLFDWRAAPQAGARRGSSLVRVDGPISESAAVGSPWWTHEHPSMKVLAPTGGTAAAGGLPAGATPGGRASGFDRGWRHGTAHRFRVVYGADRVQVSIDGKLVFDQAGPWERGRLGLYSFSQAKVRFSDVRLLPQEGLAGVPTPGGLVPPPHERSR